jgi:cytochrome c peroxidase
MMVLLGTVACFKKIKTAAQPEELGKILFFDPRISYNNTKSCGSCHDPKYAFTDGYKKSIGIYGDNTLRNSRSLVNLYNNQYFTAADSNVHSLEQQMLLPLTKNHPPELGWYNKEDSLVAKIMSIPLYKQMLQSIYGEEDITLKHLVSCIAAYVRSIKWYNTPYDSYTQGNTAALTPDALAGMKLFFSTQTQCANCHGGIDFDEPALNEHYFNVGVTDPPRVTLLNDKDEGLYALTKNESDKGKFLVPTLRNLAFTAPYYHNGSAANLATVIENYNNGGAVDAANKSRLVKKLHLTTAEKKQLLAFLMALSPSEITN